VGAEKLVAGEVAAARATFNAAGEGRGLQEIIFAAILADQEGNVSLRDQCFEEAETLWHENDRLVELTDLFRRLLAQRAWDAKAFEMLVTDSRQADAPYLYYFAGLFLGQHGQRELSEEYLQTAATSYDITNTICLLSTLALRERSIEIGPRRFAVHADSIAAQVAWQRRAEHALACGYPKEAVALMDHALEQWGDFVPALVLRGRLHNMIENYKDAVEDFETALKFDPNNVEAHQGLAWLLAACPKDEFRDGKRALEHAKLADEQMQIQTIMSLSTLAVAHAECGEFETAATLQKRVKEMPGCDTMNRVRFTTYTLGKPYREKPKTAAEWEEESAAYLDKFEEVPF